ncbi:hypothetical protein ABZ479_19910 [Streptomyces sp. NPDC005722]
MSHPARGPRRWTVRTLPDRLDKDGDPWKGLGTCRRALGPALRRLAELESAERPGG